MVKEKRRRERKGKEVVEVELKRIIKFKLKWK